MSKKGAFRAIPGWFEEMKELTAARRPMTTGSFHSLVFPPHWSGSNRAVITTSERKPPKLSSAKNFCLMFIPS
jgi:hypothetical protein